MNIFAVDEDPMVAAECLVDRHVVKMVLESTQLLCTAHRICDGDEEGNFPEFDKRVNYYKITHKNHPCSKWARKSIENYLWLAEHAIGLAKEYSYRFDKIHACQSLIYELQSPPFNIRDYDQTSFALAMPDEYKVENDPILSYRNYYNGTKQHLFRWTRRIPPTWIEIRL